MFRHCCPPWPFNTGPYQRAKQERQSDMLLFARQTAAIEPICISHLKITNQQEHRVSLRESQAEPNPTVFWVLLGKQPSKTRTER